MQSESEGTTFKREFNARLEALRGVLVLMVLTYHIGQTRYLINGEPTGILIDQGRDTSAFWELIRQIVYYLNTSGSVTVFFVLSGYVLSLSLGRIEAAAPHNVVRNFIVTRLLRLWPPLIFMLIIYVAVYYSTGATLPPAEQRDFSLRGILLHIFFVSGRINGIVWTLHVEAYATFYILLAWFIARYWGWKGLLLLTVVATMASFLYWPRIPLKRIGYPEMIFIQNFYTFSAGMLIPYVLKHIGDSLYPRLIVPIAVWSGLILLVAPFATLNDHPSIKLLCEVLGSMLLLTGIVAGGTRPVNALLDCRPMAFLGGISCSFYLLHSLPLMFLWSHPALVGYLVDCGIPNVIVALLLVILSTLLVIPLACVGYWYVELPSIEIARLYRRNRWAPQLKSVQVPSVS